jgi:hypothetical protein
MGSYPWKLSNKNVHVHADIVNLEGESIVQLIYYIKCFSIFSASTLK